ncbi:MAG: bifunctional UDP-N-acetylmuramoyl-tripeptide:D-alanyl-D-alanine ligase/alanine racemase [Muribaculaceae bacterium]|nr:bifunctional UDP-N-acetylmuramoyl-tripeptide:D-alanyl-D-alanine ligase/alanine racemase [Muribaculaceae bacterium]
MLLSDIMSVLGCRGVPVRDFEVSTLLTDSRSLADAAGTLFFALRTATGDGHLFIDRIYRKGVRAFMVDADWNPAAESEMPEATFIRVGKAVTPGVADTLAALQRVGASRRGNAARCLAITGSRGKTVLKEWLFRLLSPDMSISRSPRSFNSRIGVPLSLWLTPENTDLSIIEAGVSRTGEMAVLRNIIRPDTVIVTNVGDAHAEGFPSIEAKADEKVSLAASEPTRTLIYCADDPVVCGAVKRLSAPQLSLFGWSWSDPDAPLYITFSPEGNPSFRFGGETFTSGARFVSEADRCNVSHAVAFMLHGGMRGEEVARRLSTLTPVGTRLNVSEGVNGCMLIRDSYTSDFGSLAPALDFMSRRMTPGQEPVVIMSDLAHETGDDASTCARIAALLKTRGISRFIGVGPVLSAYSDLFGPDARFYTSADELLDDLNPAGLAGDIVLVKGAPGSGLDRVAGRLEARTHETVLEVNLDSIVANYNFFRSRLPAFTGLIAMVKASGYGAGSYEIAKTLQDCGAAYLAVAVLDEGIDLRRQGITMPVMVMNPRVVNYGVMFAHRLEPEIYSPDMLADVIAEARRHGVKRYPIHIKLDTGMHRMGFVEEELPVLMDAVQSQEGVEIRSVFSHLATADCLDMDDYTRLQLDRFERYTGYMLRRSQRPFLRHILNSAGILRFPEAHYDMARLGIGLYGVRTLPEDVEPPLVPVSALRTVIVALRRWKAGESIGYGRRTVLTRDTMVATIPVGYADGMNRRFGLGAVSVKVGGKDAPTLGNICMDACMIDVTGIDCRIGDSVEIFGPSAPVDRLAEVAGTIPYEILTSVSPRVRRIYYRE